MAGSNKQRNYFSHDSNARNSERLIRLRMRHGAAGYGVYFMIIERLREEEDYMSVKDYNVIAFDLRVDASMVKSVVEEFGLFVFTDDGKYFYSESLSKRMLIMDNQKRRKSEGGKTAMRNRWSGEINNADNQDIDNIAITKLQDSCNNKKKINKKEDKSSSPSIPQGGGEEEEDLEKKIEEYKNHKPIWKEGIQMKFGISAGDVDSYLDKFHLDMKCKEVSIRKLSALFTGWLSNELSKNADGRKHTGRNWSGNNGRRFRGAADFGCGLIED